jgi:hypothetical protein
MSVVDQRTNATTSDEAQCSWFVNSGGKVFGPYTTAQMSAFVQEERLRSTSVVKCGEAGEWMQAAVEPQLGKLFVHETLPVPPPVPSLDRRKELAAANVVVIGYFRSRSVDAFERALGQFGDVLAITPSSWILRTDLAIGVLRNDLVKFLGASDRLFIVDGKRGKVTWSNFGPSEEARMRKFVAEGKDH